MPRVDEARAYAFDADEDALRSASRSMVIASGPKHVRLALREMIASSGAHELMVTTYIHDHEERKRSYDRLASLLIDGSSWNGAALREAERLLRASARRGLPS